MSTSIKRIALVAVAALGLGVVAVAPSQAAYTPNTGLFCYTADGLATGDTTTTTVDNSNCGGVAGAYNYITLRSNAAADSVITVEGSTFGTAGSSWTVAADAKSATNAAATADNSANGAIRVNTPTVGTITVKYWKRTAGVLASTATNTVTITVSATAQSGIYSAAKSTAYIAAGETVTGITADATVIKIKSTDLGASKAAATIQVTLVDALGAAIVDTLTATVSGPGVLASNNSLTDTTTAGTADIYTKKQLTESTKGIANFFVFANGYSGVSTVTIKNEAGTVVATKSLTFFDNSVASITPTVLLTNIDGDAAATTHYAVNLVLKDSAGNLITGQSWTPTITSSASTIATATGDTTTSTSAGVVTYGIAAVGAAYGPVTITFKDATTGASTTASFVVSSKVAATATVANVNVAAGDSVAYVLTLKDANGYAVPDGVAASNYISTIASTGGITSEPSTTDVKTKAGAITVKGTAPLVSTTITSTFTLTGTAGTASSYFSKTLAGTTLTPTATVSNAAADLAIDAANDAATAAQDATDAALSAAEAAEAATDKAQQALDAVNDLAAQVNTLISALKSQIKTLSTLVTKIAKKVGA